MKKLGNNVFWEEAIWFIEIEYSISQSLIWIVPLHAYYNECGSGGNFMFWMFLIQLAFVVPLWMAAFVQFIIAVATKQRARATVFAILTFAPIFLIGSVLASAYRAPQEDQSKDIFFEVFLRPPPLQIKNLKAQKLPEEDELKPEPIFLSFHSSPQTMLKLTNYKFARLSDKKRKTFTISDWQSPPSWFSTKITPETEIYISDGQEMYQGQLLFYEPISQTARVFRSTSKTETAPE